MSTNAPKARRNPELTANYKYVLDLGAYIASEESKLSMNPDFDERTIDPNVQAVFSKYETVRSQIPGYFFRTPRTAIQCHTSMVDALEVMQEDRDILNRWNDELNSELASLKRAVRQ